MHTAAWLCTHANNNCSNVYINICGLGIVSSASSPLLNDAQIKCVTLLNSIAYCSHRLEDITHAWWYFKTNSPPTLSNATTFKLNLLSITNLYAKLFPDMQNVVPDMLSVSVWQISINSDHAAGRSGIVSSKTAAAALSYYLSSLRCFQASWMGGTERG